MKLRKSLLSSSAVILLGWPLASAISCSPEVNIPIYSHDPMLEMQLWGKGGVFASSKDYQTINQVTANWKPNHQLSEQDFADLGIIDKHETITSLVLQKSFPVLWLYPQQPTEGGFGIHYLRPFANVYGDKYIIDEEYNDSFIEPYVQEIPQVSFKNSEDQDFIQNQPLIVNPDNNHQASLHLKANGTFKAKEILAYFKVKTNSPVPNLKETKWMRIYSDSSKREAYIHDDITFKYRENFEINYRAFYNDLYTSDWYTINLSLN